MNSKLNIAQPISLPQLGWQPFFQQQLTLDDYENTVFARIVAHHRSEYLLASEQGEIALPIHHDMPKMTVGDWVILDSEKRFSRLLDRSSLFSRKAAGSKIEEQYISANIDTVFIVCSLNNDFNLSRIERYLALINGAQVESVIVLTKADLCEDVEEKRQQVQRLDPMLMIETVNALDNQDVEKLRSWCRTGKTVAFMGSSGVGKSTLVNTLLESNEQLTGGIREDDSKGRHTTTSRSMHVIPDGGLLLDTPGMRELQLADCEVGVSETFSDIEEITLLCRFSDCQHETEPGCAVKKALASGEIDERRLNNYYKLLREQARNGATLAEQRANDKALHQYYQTVQSGSRKRKQGL